MSNCLTNLMEMYQFNVTLVRLNGRIRFECITMMYRKYIVETFVK